MTNNNLVPTAAQQQGNFSSLSVAINAAPVSPKVPFPGNIIPASRLSPQAAFFLPFYPQANTASGLFNYVPSSRNTVDKFDTRVDHYFSRADSLTGTYSFNQVLNYAPGAFLANGAVTQAVRRQAAALSETHSFGPSTLNELRVNYVRTRESNSPQGLGTNYRVQSGIGGFTEQSGVFPGFPGLSISGYLGFNENAFVPIIFRDNTREISDSVTWLRGAHMFKAGGLFRYYDRACCRWKEDGLAAREPGSSSHARSTSPIQALARFRTGDIPGLTFDNPKQSMRLWSDSRSVELRFKPSPKVIGGVCRGWMHFWLEGVLMADVPVVSFLAEDSVPDILRSEPVE